MTARPGRTNVPSPCAFVRVQGKQHAATAASFTDDRLTLVFGDTGLSAVLNTDTHPFGIVLTVESVNGGGIDGLTFLNVPLTVKGRPDEPFGVCAHSLNLITRVDALPALQTELRASCEKKLGLVGAKVAIVAAPMEKMLPALQETLSSTSELPVCKVAGPWARDIPFNHGSSLFNCGSLTETNLDEWIEMTRSLGFTQIDNHGGGKFFRFGDMELNREKWPDDWESWKRIVARLHEKGIGSIFHTYAFFIDKQSKYVTPVPDSRLDAFRTFTLAEPLAADATEITVNESTANMSTITGFFEHNSVVLHIGNELVTFGGFTKEAPWKLTGLKRGAHGTKAAAHDKGAKARHLKECFGLFVPNPESSLFEEIAAHHADVVNRCGFDGIYLDAIDGSSILRGGDEVWYWGNKFVVEIQKRLKKPVGMEMSAMWHHFWQYRTRWQAWDYPQRGHKRFVDLHAEGVNGGLLLPLHLGWWGFQSWNPPQIEPTYPDVMENLGAKLIGWDAGISLTAGVNRDALRNTPLFQRAVDILRTCEELRHAKAFDETVKARLREPGKEFALFKDSAGKPRFRRVQSQSQTVNLSEPWTLSWNVTNSFREQPAKFRVEALMFTPISGNTNSTRLMEFKKSNLTSLKLTTADGVKASLQPQSSDEDSTCTLVALNSGKVSQNAAWVRIEKRFDPALNLKDHQGLNMTIRSREGGADGALVAVRLESPHHLAYGAIADRYVTVKSNSCRIYSLVETESSRWSDFNWNDGKALYNVYRETVNFSAIESASVWLQNLPPNQEVRIDILGLRAVPLRTGVVKNPKLTVGETTIEFPVELSSGSWIESNGPDDCAVYGSKGEPLGKVTPRGSWPTLKSGVTPMTLSCEVGEGLEPRARVTLFKHGEEL
ncbi:MAG: hypothetical protein KJ070_12915 [Verrucomicrobia bacterium]|nr:hypothetical protein [Verrucomicrobiota bacterium]